jgi:hypothetical protein
MSWTYKQNKIGDISQFPENTLGFIYMVTYKPTGKSYIGKKVLYHTKKMKIGKRELAKMEHVVGRKPSYRLAVKESDWKTYYGSQTSIKQVLLEEGPEAFSREILKFATTKKLLTYYEVKYQMVYQVLEKPEEFYNDNILGKFYTKDFTETEFEDFLELDK